ncbi:hypothetical protein [Synechococcus elongatus]|uniref:hypothetical protein n=1 Tax=Synechococcus elongatus TaxID=32046 RepID=UPI000F7E0295|nr:hypothetical protein [Synechococcus elongatus]
MSFFPSDYTPVGDGDGTPKDDRYFNVGSMPKDKDIVIRLFGPSLTGWQWFTEAEGKTTSHLSPFHQYPGKHPPGIKKAYGSEKPDSPKRVLICLIWNGTEEKFQVAKFDRATVIKEIEKVVIPAEGYEEEHAFQFLPVEGSPFTVANFGLILKKTGEKKDTEYSVKTIMRRANKSLIEDLIKLDPQPYLPALFVSEDPWLGKGNLEVTPSLPTTVRDENGADHEVNF